MSFRPLKSFKLISFSSTDFKVNDGADVPVAGTVATCAVFAPSAIGHAMRGAVNLEQDRNAPARATDLVMTGVAGSEVLQATHGVKLTVDLSA